MKRAFVTLSTGAAAPFALGTTGVVLECEDNNECVMHIAPLPIGLPTTCEATECYNPFGDLLVDSGGMSGVFELTFCFL